MVNEDRGVENSEITMSSDVSIMLGCLKKVNIRNVLLLLLLLLRLNNVHTLSETKGYRTD